MPATYDTIGINYSDLRKPDRRIEATIWAALGPAKTVLNVGAGTGSYEPADRHVTAVEPSAEALRSRRWHETQCIFSTSRLRPRESSIPRLHTQNAATGIHPDS